MAVVRPMNSARGYRVTTSKPRFSLHRTLTLMVMLLVVVLLVAVSLKVALALALLNPDT